LRPASLPRVGAAGFPLRQGRHLRLGALLRFDEFLETPVGIGSQFSEALR
jgi:hypothetical protein